MTMDLHVKENVTTLSFESRKYSDLQVYISWSIRSNGVESTSLMSLCHEVQTNMGKATIFIPFRAL